MGTRREDLIAQLETYTRTTREQMDNNPEQVSYWRGVLFGLELALLEVRKQPTAPDRTLGILWDFFTRQTLFCKQARRAIA